MSSAVKTFRSYTAKCRPVWTLTWRECVSPSIHSGSPADRDIDIEFNKKIAKKYIEKYGIDYIINNLSYITNYLNTKPQNYIRYVAKSSVGYSHKILTPERQAMRYFLAILNVVIFNRVDY